MVASAVEILDYETDEIVAEVSLDGVLRTDDDVVESLMQDITRSDGAIGRRSADVPEDGEGSTTELTLIEPGDDEYFLALAESLPSPYEIDNPPEDYVPEGSDE